MASTLLADARPPSPAPPLSSDLLVLWQHPESREIAPIGRLTHHGSDFAFSYTQAAAQIEGFRVLPGLPDLRRSYRSAEIPLVFGQRVLARSRPDYANYIRSLGLDPADATPWEQIVSSGGHREGDTLQFLVVPEVRGGNARVTFLANGVRHIPDDELRFDGRTERVSRDQQESKLLALHGSETLRVVPEDENAHDANACLIVAGSTPVAWVPRFLAPSFRELLRSGDVSVRVERVGAREGSPHLRLTLELDHPAPAGFTFDQDGLWAPLSA